MIARETGRESLVILKQFKSAEQAWLSSVRSRGSVELQFPVSASKTKNTIDVLVEVICLEQPLLFGVQEFELVRLKAIAVLVKENLTFSPGAGVLDITVCNLSVSSADVSLSGIDRLPEVESIGVVFSFLILLESTNKVEISGGINNRLSLVNLLTSQVESTKEKFVVTDFLSLEGLLGAQALVGLVSLERGLELLLGLGRAEKMVVGLSPGGGVSLILTLDNELVILVVGDSDRGGTGSHTTVLVSDDVLASVFTSEGVGVPQASLSDAEGGQGDQSQRSLHFV